MTSSHPSGLSGTAVAEGDIFACTADRSHFRSLIDLGRSHYAHGHPVLSLEFLRWFLLDNPAGAATLVVTRERGLWIGIIMLIPILLEDAQAAQRACFAVNVLTHPEHRSKNLFVKMIRYTRDYLSRNSTWLLGHPNANALPGWKRQKMQFRDPLDPFLVKFQNPFSSLRIARIRMIDELKALPAEFWNELSARPDVHVKYTPEFISWRFLEPPHRSYVVSAIHRGGELLGLRVTRRLNGPIDLMVDVIGTAAKSGGVLRSVRRPTLLMHPGLGYSGRSLRSECWKLPTWRRFSFFVSTWGTESSGKDMSGISLAASDF